MNPKHKNKRTEIKQIKTISEYNEYVNTLKITDEQKQLMYYVFVKGYDYRLIADKLGVSESTIKARMRRLLKSIT